MPIVELVYALDCPNVSRTREHLVEAFRCVGLAPEWLEHDVNDPATPAHVRGRGSPAVLVDGRDILHSDGSGGACCRVYRDGEGKLTGAPPVKDIVAAILRAKEVAITVH